MSTLFYLVFSFLRSSLRSRAALQAEIRRECLDHVMIFSEQGLRRILKSYFEYYEKSRTHLGLAKDSRIQRPIQPPAIGKLIAFPQVCGLHHRCERRAA